MIIETPTIHLDEKIARLECKFSTRTTEDVLWFAVPLEYQHYLVNERCDGFVVALLLLAMQTGEDIEVKGVLSEQLHYNLQLHLIKLVCRLFPSMMPISIRAESFDNGRAFANGIGVALGFSGGVDSFATTYDHLENRRTPASFRVTHFIFNNVGSHGHIDSPESRTLFNQRYEMLSGFPQAVGKEFIKIDSNLNSCLRVPFPSSHTLRNVACVLILQKLFGKYLYSAGYQYADCQIAPEIDMAKADPLILPMLSTENLRCISTGGQYSRPEKTALVSKYAPASRFLNVCISGSRSNCSVCEKCCRTLFTAELLGCVNFFQNIFDLPRFNSVKRKYLAQVLAAPEREFNREILELAAEKEFDFSLRVRVTSVLYRFQTRLRRALRAHTPKSVLSLVRKLRSFLGTQSRTFTAAKLGNH